MEKESDHEYCKLHDILFESWEDYGVHRVNYREHKTCEFCFKDFGSQNGLDLHVSQLHRNSKSTICPYCDKKFKGGIAGLSMHIESNQCKGGMTREEMNGRVNAIRVGLGPVAHDKWNQLQPNPSVGDTSTKQLNIDDATKQLRTMGLIDNEEGNDLGITQDNIQDYYRDLHRKYVCPCGKKFGQKQSMWQHVQSIAHQKKSFTCVGCQKYFRSSSAMIQHQESGACYIARPEAFVAADRATGGLASAACEAGGWKE
ncbi:hypothetical protein BDD12DRAFT_885235 [Trichophaea hybrida]|nr:hypothetical protein BDD12DRAFT_885235 [Trichophaea hybrida]